MIAWIFISVAATLGLFRFACESFEGQLGRKAGWNEETGAWREFKALIPRFARRPSKNSAESAGA